LRGGIKAYSDGTITTIANNSAMHQELQTLEETTYDSRWLVPEYDVAKIGETKYIKLADAISAAEENDTIELIANTYIFSSISIPAEKQFTIKTNNYQIFPNNSLVNNGKVSIINDSMSQKCDIEYYGTGYAVINNEDAEMSLKNIKICANDAISNSGSLISDTITISSNNASINNAGNAIARDSDITSNSSYAIYNNGGEISVIDTAITGIYIYNNAGKISLSGSIANYQNPESGTNDFITNKGTITLESSQVLLTASTNHRAIYNTGTLSTTNNTTITHEVANGSTSTYALYDDGGTIYTSDSSITLAITYTEKDYTDNIYAVYSPTGNVTIESGSVFASGRGPIYGIYTKTGHVTIGVPEPDDSIYIGTDQASVSKTNPEIKAISTATNSSYKVGIGIKNDGQTGVVEYYDGKIAGSSKALPEPPSITEYLYEVCLDTDTTVTPNLEFAGLSWIRDGQSSCTH